MNLHLKKLAGLGTDSLGDQPVEAEGLMRCLGPEGARLSELLHLKNGFYAFESALHVLSFGRARDGRLGVGDWNRKELWIGDYGGMADGNIFFAEDVFGNQFCLREGQVMSFDPETGTLEHIAPGLDAWAADLLENYNVRTGHSLARAWQVEHGPIPLGRRLVPKQLFVLGGEYSVENLYALDAVEAMKMRASVALQTRDLPDGTKVNLVVG
jgi:hypothetical protein